MKDSTVEIPTLGYVTSEQIVEWAREGRAFVVPSRIVQPFPGLPFGFTCSLQEAVPVECHVVEDRYKLSDNYKIALQPEDSRYERHHLYLTDCAQMVRSGYIRVKD